MGKPTFLYRHITISLFVSLVHLSSCAVNNFRIDKTSLKKYFETNSTFRESHTGLLVYDIEKKSVIFNYNAQKHFTPASNTKLLTWYAAMKMLQDSIPSFEYCVINDSLYFTGTGDPSLLYANFEYAKTLYFFQSSPHHLVNIQKPMVDQRFGTGWAWDDYPFYYSAEKSSFPIYGNMVKIHKNLNSDFVSITPEHFEASLSLYQDNSINSYKIEREERKNLFILKFNGKPISIDGDMPFIYSNELFAILLSDTLKRPIYQNKKFPNCKTDIFYSVPVDSILKHLLIESDNFLAEQMLLLISNQLGDSLNSEKTINFMMKHHLDAWQDQIRWVDGSGLSRYNQVTPNALVSILERIYHEISKEKLFALLPHSGKNGTLKTSFPKLNEKIHAKTGSMSHVYNLTGFLETNSGKMLLFSFMNNNFNVSNSKLKEEMEKVLLLFFNDKK